MEFLTEYWWVIIVVLAALVGLGLGVYHFFKRPTKEQLNKLKEWLLYAVTEAEKVLGGGTGQIKLRYVYDMFLTKFPVLSKIISFSLFSTLVDEVLDNFRNILSTNEKVQSYVEEGSVTELVILTETE